MSILHVITPYYSKVRNATRGLKNRTAIIFVNVPFLFWYLHVYENNYCYFICSCDWTLIPFLKVTQKQKTSHLFSSSCLFQRTSPCPEVFQLPGFNSSSTRLKSGPILIINSRTLYITNLYLDGKALNLRFWIGNGSTPSEAGSPVPDEDGSISNLHSYFGENVYIKLQNVTLKNVSYFGVWSVSEKKVYGHVAIPRILNVSDQMGCEQISVSAVRMPRFMHQIRWCTF